jgi:hypothetical protein
MKKREELEKTNQKKKHERTHREENNLREPKE